MAATAMAAVSAPSACDGIIDPSLSSNANSVSVSIPRLINHAANAPTRHLPYCPPGSLQDSGIEGLSDSDSDEDYERPDRSLLYPPDAYEELLVLDLPVYAIDPCGIAAAVDHMARQPLPPSKRVFPWLHGLNPNNNVQSAFFGKGQKQRPPACMRSITIVKADGNLGYARLKGALAPSDIITNIARDRRNPRSPGASQFGFIEVEPRSGFSVRNFQIQSVKLATISDVIVYGEDRDRVFHVAHGIAEAQVRWRAKMNEKSGPGELPVPRMNVFVCVTPFSVFEEQHPDIVSIDSHGNLTGNVVDLQAQERAEMYEMTKPTEIAPNVWLGPTPSTAIEPEFDVFIECSDGAELNPNAFSFSLMSPLTMEDGSLQVANLEFPGSGSVACSSSTQSEIGKVVEICRWIYHMANGTLPGKDEMADVGITRQSSLPTCSSAFSDDEDDHEEVQHVEHAESLATAADEDTVTEIDEAEVFDLTVITPTPQPRKVLFHCGDGYTETSLLAIAYYSFVSGWSIPEAWLSLHIDLKRNFFAYPSDVAFLRNLSYALLRASPCHKAESPERLQVLARDEPRWFRHIDGSLPSRVTDYMYLGNLEHADNPDLLRALGITQILSVGEVSNWRDGELDRWGAENVYQINGIQDNGMDTLTHHFQRAFEFLDRARLQGKATLVHCRVGVSRSATICIAEIMRTFHLSLPRAYCYVRARRLNVIIQPHLRFTYELLRWEEATLSGERPSTAVSIDSRDGSNDANRGYKRELEWAQIAREIALLNQPFVCRFS